MNESKWTTFMDMYSGGCKSQDWEYALIEGDEDTAIETFTCNFGDPFHVSCECCGSDYSVTEHDTKEQALDYLCETEETIGKNPNIRVIPL